MFLYTSLTLILLSASFVELFAKISKIRILYIFYMLSFTLWILSFIRWEVGTDWDSYYLIYLNCNYIDWYEWGFLILNRLVRNTVNNYSVVLAILGGILFYFQTKAIKKISILPLTTLFILWGTDLGNIFFVRQSIAMAILLYSITQIEQHRLKNYLILITGATLIHAASIVFLPAYWIYHRKFTLIQIATAFIISISLGTIGGAYIWGNLGKLLGGIYATKVEGYINEGTEATFNEGMSATALYIRSIGGKILLILLFILFITKKYSKETHGMINLFLFATIMLPITSSVSPALGRMWTPYFQVQVLLIAFILTSATKKANKMILFIILIIITIIRLYLKLFIDYDGKAFLPFQTIFS